MKEELDLFQISQNKRFLTLQECQKIEELIKQGVSAPKIGKIIGRSKTTIVSAIKRNGGRENFKSDKAIKRIEAARDGTVQKGLRKRLENLEMQFEILIDIVKELKRNDTKNN